MLLPYNLYTMDDLIPPLRMGTEARQTARIIGVLFVEYNGKFPHDEEVEEKRYRRHITKKGCILH